MALNYYPNEFFADPHAIDDYNKMVGAVDLIEVILALCPGCLGTGTTVYSPEEAGPCPRCTPWRKKLRYHFMSEAKDANSPI